VSGCVEQALRKLEPTAIDVWYPLRDSVDKESETGARLSASMMRIICAILARLLAAPHLILLTRNQVYNEPSDRLPENHQV